MNWINLLNGREMDAMKDNFFFDDDFVFLNRENSNCCSDGCHEHGHCHNECCCQNDPCQNDCDDSCNDWEDGSGCDCDCHCDDMDCGCNDNDCGCDDDCNHECVCEIVCDCSCSHDSCRPGCNDATQDEPSGNCNEDAANSNSDWYEQPASNPRRKCCCESEEDRKRCRQLMKRIMILDFALQEVILYLDMHPCNCKALRYYQRLKKELDRLICMYENNCGPLSGRGNMDSVDWNWNKEAWPWERGY